MIGTIGSIEVCSCCVHGPQSNGQPRSTGRGAAGARVTAGNAEMRSYQSASWATTISLAPWTGQVFTITTRWSRRSITAGMLRRHTAHRLVVSRSRTRRRYWNLRCRCIFL